MRNTTDNNLPPTPAAILTNKTDNNNNNISSSSSWGITNTIRSRIKGGGGGIGIGRNSPVNVTTEEDVLPLLRQTDSFSDTDFGGNDALSSPPPPPPNKSPVAAIAAATTRGVPTTIPYYVQWLKLLCLSLFSSYCLYYTPAICLELFFFPAHGKMTPNGFQGMTVVPDVHYSSTTTTTNNHNKINNYEDTDDLVQKQSPSSEIITTATTTHIPRIVHVTYKSREELPNEWKESLKEWERIHPNWEIHFWSDIDIMKFVHEEYNELEELFLSYKYMIQRVDSVRYMILKKYGGLYSDMDIYPATNLDILLQQWEDSNKNVLLAESYNMGVTNAFMASSPQATFMTCVISNLASYQHGWYHWIHWQHWEVLSSAGSTFLWGMVGHCLDDGVQILAASSFRGCSVCDAWEKGDPSAVTTCDTEWLHHSSTNSSWHQHKNLFHAILFNISYSFLCRPFRACFITVTIILILLRRRKNNQNINNNNNNNNTKRAIKA